MKVEIVSAETREQSGVSQRTGKNYHIRKQQAFAHLDGQKYPVAFTLNVPNDRQPYLPGFYSVDDNTFYVDKFGGLAISQEMRLLPSGSTSQLVKTA